MDFGKQHLDKCSTKDCDERINHMGTNCKGLLCNRCLLEANAPASKKTESEWDPYADSD